MQWITHYQLFLFDFDGLLVDTEFLHYQAYIHMCAQRGFHLNWSFSRYAELAYNQTTAFSQHIYAELPALKIQEPHWQVLYEEKKQALLNLAEKETVSLMPGAAQLLLALQEADINRCVVTHSPQSLIHLIREQNHMLNTIPHWITREHYTHPKPNPECYQLAISTFAQSGDRLIGFEDSPRGLQALLATQATPVLICPPDLPYLSQLLDTHKNIHYYPSFTAINDHSFPIR